MSRRFAVVAALFGLMPATALAHAFLDHAVPPVGGTVSGPPREIRLFFSESVEPAFSGIAVSGADGKALATGAATIAPGDKTQLVLPMPPLAPGTYVVRWHAVSVDTHRTEGHFAFTVRP